MNKHDYRFFEFARQEAEKSDFERFHLGCIVTYKNHIIGRGCNGLKTDPAQKHYNRKRNFSADTKGKPIKHSRHAEIAALKSIPYPIASTIDWSKVKVYVYRVSPGNPLGYSLARPCKACMKAIRDKGITKIYYTTQDGFAQERVF